MVFCNNLQFAILYLSSQIQKRHFATDLMREFVPFFDGHHLKLSFTSKDFILTVIPCKKQTRISLLRNLLNLITKQNSRNPFSNVQKLGFQVVEDGTSKGIDSFSTFEKQFKYVEFSSTRFTFQFLVSRVHTVL